MYSFVLCIAQGHDCLQAATLLLNHLIQRRGRVLLSCVGHFGSAENDMEKIETREMRV